MELVGEVEKNTQSHIDFSRFQKQKNQMKKQKPDTRMGYDFEDAKTQRPANELRGMRLYEHRVN